MAEKRTAPMTVPPDGPVPWHLDFGGGRQVGGYAWLRARHDGTWTIHKEEERSYSGDWTDADLRALTSAAVLRAAMLEVFRHIARGIVTESELNEEMLRDDVLPRPRPWAGEGDLPELSQRIRAARRITGQRAQPLVARHTPKRHHRVTAEFRAEVLRRFDGLEGGTVEQRVEKLAAEFDREKSSIYRYLREAKREAGR